MTHVALHGNGRAEASASSAGDEPPLLRTAGWIRRDISRSSSTTLVARSAKPPTSLRDQPLLRSVVEVALDAAAGVVRAEAALKSPGARRSRPGRSGVGPP